jgi:O-acetylserine/cysteine efflux transporter
VPFVAALASSAVFGERFGPARLAGIAFVLLGLVFVAIPVAVGREAGLRTD